MFAFKLLLNLPCILQCPWLTCKIIQSVLGNKSDLYQVSALQMASPGGTASRHFHPEKSPPPPLSQQEWRMILPFNWRESHFSQAEKLTEERKVALQLHNTWHTTPTQSSHLGWHQDLVKVSGSLTRQGGVLTPETGRFVSIRQFNGWYPLLDELCHITHGINPL